MRLLHVVPTYFPAVRYGGPIFAVHGLCRALAVRGHDVHVFTTSLDGPANSNVPHEVPVHLDGVKVHYFESNFLKRLSWSPTLAQTLGRELAATDIVHVHTVFLWPTLAAARLSARHAVPYVLSPRGMLVRDLLERRHKLLKSTWIRLIEKYNVEKAAAIHVTSQLEAVEFSRFNFDVRRIEIVPNGADTPESIAPRETLPADLASLRKDDAIILYFGRLSWKKGLERLLHGFAQSNAGTLAIVGTDDENLAPRLHELGQRLNIAHRLRIIPRTVLGGAKEYVFAQASAFVLTSDSENFGNTVIEAMRRGVPVIVTAGVGASEIVRTSGGGVIVDDQPRAIGAAIDSLTLHTPLAREMGAAGQRYIVDNLSWAAVAKRMEHLYSTLRR